MSSNDHNSAKCIWSARIIANDWRTCQCLPCFFNIATRPAGEAPIIISNIRVKHRFVKGPYTPYLCQRCRQNIVREKPIDQCPLCSEKYHTLITKFTEREIPVDTSWFMYDVHDDELLYLRPATQGWPRAKPTQ